MPLEAEEAQRVQLGLKIQQAQTQVGRPAPERPALRLRAEAQREGIELTPRDWKNNSTSSRRCMRNKNGSNYAVGLYEDLAQGVGSAWTSALTSIADGTRTVGEAFREMGRAMLQTMAQIAAQEAFRGLLRLGIGLLTGGLAPRVAGTTPGGAFTRGQRVAVLPSCPRPSSFRVVSMGASFDALNWPSSGKILPTILSTSSTASKCRGSCPRPFGVDQLQAGRRLAADRYF